MDRTRVRQLDVIRRQYANVYYTHKAHEKERERASRRVRLEKWIRIALTFTAALTISVEAVSSPSIGAIVSAVIGSLPFLFSLYRLSTSPESRVHSHTIAAKQFKAERDNLLNLIEECMSGEFSTEEIRSKFRAIEQRIVAMDLPTVYASNEAYSEGAKALSTTNGEVSSRSQINNILPEHLRLEDSGTGGSDGSNESDLPNMIGFVERK